MNQTPSKLINFVSCRSILSFHFNYFQAIYKEGGKKFWIHNTGPLGCLPQKLSLVQKNARDIDPYGCIASYNDAARLFNEALKHLCQEMRSELKDATIVYVDVYAIKYDLIANSTSYGMSSHSILNHTSPFFLFWIQ